MSSLWAVCPYLSLYFTPLLHPSNQNTAIQNSCTRLNQACLFFSLSPCIFFSFYLYSGTFQRILVMIGSNKNNDCYVLYILPVLRGYLSDGPLGPPQRGDKSTEVDLPYRVCSSSHSSVLLSCVGIAFLLPQWFQSYFKLYTHYLYACNFAKGQCRQPVDSMDEIATQVVPS